MSRLRRSFEAATSYHVTLRCNNQAFDLRWPQARKVILFCLARAKEKFAFDLFGLCVMSNHVHYLIRPARPEEMPRLMHWLNWYSAMLLNRLLRRRGHFWERTTPSPCPIATAAMPCGCCATSTPTLRLPA